MVNLRFFVPKMRPMSRRKVAASQATNRWAFGVVISAAVCRAFERHLGPWQWPAACTTDRLALEEDLRYKRTGPGAV
jgi:hypothetical protein